MNITYTNESPTKAALEMCDKHSFKLTVEVGQMLANAYTVEQLTKAPLNYKGEVRSNRCHPHHPFSKWVLASKAHWDWALEYAIVGVYDALERGVYKKEPHHLAFLEWCVDNPPNLPYKGFLGVPAPKGYEHMGNTIYAHRAYFIDEKQHLAKWSNTQEPSWFIRK